MNETIHSRYIPVKILQTPVTERYARSEGDFDPKTNAIRMAGCWFYNCNDGRWKTEPSIESLQAKKDMKTKQTTPKISFQKHWSKEDGTVYNQTVRIDKLTFDKLKDAVYSERALNFPRKNEYVQTSGGECFLYCLLCINGICEMNITQRNFVNLFLKLPLKDRNTRFVVK